MLTFSRRPLNLTTCCSRSVILLWHLVDVGGGVETGFHPTARETSEGGIHPSQSHREEAVASPQAIIMPSDSSPEWVRIPQKRYIWPSGAISVDEGGHSRFLGGDWDEDMVRRSVTVSR